MSRTKLLVFLFCLLFPIQAFAACGFGSLGSGKCVGGLVTTSGSSQTWNVPSDWTNTNTVEAIGGGAGGAYGDVDGGGGGGAYTKATNVTGLTPGGTTS